MQVTLRETRDSDLPVFFAQSNEPAGIQMAAFTTKDPTDQTHFDAHWARIRRDPTVVGRTIVGPGGEIIGHIAAYGPAADREITYWIGQEHWGQGAATAALRQLLLLVPEVLSTAARPRTTAAPSG